ncbi:MAG TPA: Yip1 family protein [Marinobacter sp.]|nr:Yip1 family protein [Marinobacter sp.]
MLLSHAVGLFTRPGEEWAFIKNQRENATRHYVLYIVILSAIAPICAYISTAHFGWSVGNERLIRLTEISAVQLSVLTYLAMLVGVFALGYAIHWMAKTYGAKDEPRLVSGVALAAYSCTPLFLAGFALLYPVPWFNAAVFLAAACYGAWLMYDGLPVVMGVEKGQAVMYGGALLTVALVILVSTRVGSVILWNLGVGPVFISG